MNVTENTQAKKIVQYCHPCNASLELDINDIQLRETRHYCVPRAYTYRYTTACCGLIEQLEENSIPPEILDTLHRLQKIEEKY